MKLTELYGPLKRVLGGSDTLNFDSISAQDYEDLTIAVAGAEVGNPVVLGLPPAPEPGVAFNAFVSAADTVTVRAYNYTSGPIDPASADYRVFVLKH